MCVDKAAVLLLTTLEQIVWQTHSLFLQGLSMNLTYLFHELTFIVVCAKWCNCSLGAQSILVTIHFPESRKICQESASHCTLFKRSEEHSFFFCTMHGIVMSVVMALVYPLSVTSFVTCLPHWKTQRKRKPFQSCCSVCTGLKICRKRTSKKKQLS